MGRVTAVRWAVRATEIALIVAAGATMPHHPVAATAMLVVVTLMFVGTWWIQRDLERLARAVELADVDAIERVARESVAHRYEARILLALTSSVARARALGRVTTCVCGECALEELDHELDLALRALERVAQGEHKIALALLRDATPPSELSPASRMRPTLSVYVMLMSGKLPLSMLPKIVTLERTLPIMRWPLELAVAKTLVAHDDIDGARLRLARAPAPWRNRLG